jgi:predicted HTH transcriptional regulator
MPRAYFINLIGDSTMNLWDIPHSRTSDPLSSYVAGDRHHLSGKAESHRQQILEFMRGKRPMTSKQIALEMGMDRHEVARRLPEMARKGLVMRQDRNGGETLWYEKT